MPKSLFITSLYLLFSYGTLLAQEDSVTLQETMPEVTSDSTSSAKGFALAISADYGKAFESLASEQLKWEFGLVGLINDKVALVGEFGYGKLLPASVIQNGTYEVEGNYYRVGVEYIFTLLPKYYLNIGAMYANSTFADFGTVQISSEFWPDVNEEFRRDNLTANWAELILHSQGPLVNAESGFLSNLSWGIRFRLRLMITNLEQPEFDIYAVPGFGKAYSPVVPAANLFLRYRISF